ncbi:hypothetical protein HMPREF1544_06391 [Mucor circinelloides 1006PhL]|uniref:ABC transporter family G domain-containing protein n=1 Tax=Mucor circinelloides f. circinelloides (strain 1006PhL) TaxID=1220926 RepID=S2JE84_MUCC1|nr:hypothetical protein HMPREF1544_06391 [Mucor circinelloides 1006PhL]
MRVSYTSIDGDVSYGGIDAHDFGKHFKDEVCYNEGKKLYYSTLTTEQTLLFALKNRTPSTRIPGESKQDSINSVPYLSGNMLGLIKQMTTRAGNAFVHGLFGGERKRLSIAGIALLVVSMPPLPRTTLLYPRIVELFDKVMVLYEGRCIYFGLTSEPKPCFTDIGSYCPPRKSVPDFLTVLCNLNERQAQSQLQYHQISMNAARFEKHYKEFAMFDKMIAERDEHEKHINQDKPYESFPKALTIRQFQLIWGDKYSLCAHGDVVVKGLMTASVFYMMPLNGSDAFAGAGSYLFSLVFNAFIAQSELRYLCKTIVYWKSTSILPSCIIYLYFTLLGSLWTSFWLSSRLLSLKFASTFSWA